MTRTGKATSPATQTSDDYYNLLHTVSYFEYIIADRLRARIPRALCGELLIGDPDRPDPGPNSPRCPRCEKKRAR